MKSGAILANMGHSNTEIDVARWNSIAVYLHTVEMKYL